MKYSILYVFFFLVTGLSLKAQEQKMTAAEVAAFKNEVTGQSKNTKTLTAGFTQYKHSGLLAKDNEAQGKMTFKAPGSLLWQYTAPYKYSMVFKNGKVSINNEGKKSKVNTAGNKMFGKLGGLITNTISGNVFNDKEFDIAYTKSKGYNIMKLSPKDASLKKYVKQMDLYFDAKNLVSEVILTEASGDYTKIVFKNQSVNAPVSDTVFEN